MFQVFALLSDLKLGSFFRLQRLKTARPENEGEKKFGERIKMRSHHGRNTKLNMSSKHVIFAEVRCASRPGPS